MGPSSDSSMKATVVFLTFIGALALGSVVPNQQQQQQKVADQEFLQKQHNILKLFVNVKQPNHDQEQAQTGNAFDLRSQINSFSNSYAVKEFINAREQGLLPRGQVFNVHNQQHLNQAIKLFDIFYFAKDFNTFYQAACWAKQRVNEGQYIYALAVAVYNRPDTQGIQIPPLSEVQPNNYVDNQAIQRAQHLKQQGQRTANILSNYTGQYPNWQNDNQDEQQQPNQPQPYEPQPYQPDQPNQPDQPYEPDQPDQPGQRNNYPYPHQNFEQQQNNAQQQNPESIVSYYREDAGLNQLYAQLHVQQPWWFNTQKYQANKQQNQGYGENVYYLYQQVLARYNLERLANQLPPVTPISYNQPIQPGYAANVQHGNGEQFPPRPDNVVLSQDGNQKVLTKVQDYERRIRDAVDAQFVYANDGSKVKLTAENGIEILGKLIQNNPDAVNNNYYGNQDSHYGYVQLLKKLVGHVVDPYNIYGTAPGVVENYNAAFRDPVTYQILARVVRILQSFKNQIQPYKQEQVKYQGVKVSSVQTDKLVTYFDSCSISLYNALSYEQSQQPQNFDYNAHQLCLNNKPFTYRININSDKNEDAIVRVFIGPKYNAQGQPLSLQQAKNHFVEIDRFVTKLRNGQNTVERNSRQSNVYVEDQPDTDTLFKTVQQAQQGGQPFYYTENQNEQNGFPQRLILPKGNRNGQPLVLFVIVNKYEPANNQNPDQAINIYQVQDNRPQGYPLDRQINNETLYANAPNTYFKEVTVYYQPRKQVEIEPEQ